MQEQPQHAQETTPTTTPSTRRIGKAPMQAETEPISKEPKTFTTDEDMPDQEAEHASVQLSEVRVPPPQHKLESRNTYACNTPQNTHSIWPGRVATVAGPQRWYHLLLRTLLLLTQLYVTGVHFE
eukprot:CAMPEP_0113247952 /NCGR_PEP_ID=MMETSP0008_2-20120614/10260_1 /TAXON_ID=97485 /ORGANISM="Prymnesium parvum" /LENGTH=124 /DNA_ID=CAMNT_0000095773 /DNA_START=171 /DNA_END=542 /DNA_ORIENTATION=+ /assembly_acc=CAM_ASM_000153